MMATNLTRLRGRAGSKGAPPPAEETTDVTADPRAAAKAEKRPLQVRVPRDVFEEFSERAGREFGFTHGAKKRLFLKMWAAYKAQS